MERWRSDTFKEYKYPDTTDKLIISNIRLHGNRNIWGKNIRTQHMSPISPHQMAFIHINRIWNGYTPCFLGSTPPPKKIPIQLVSSIHTRSILMVNTSILPPNHLSHFLATLPHSPMPPRIMVIKGTPAGWVYSTFQDHVLHHST